MSTRQDPRRYRSTETECESCGAVFRDSDQHERSRYEPALCRDCRDNPDLGRD